MSRGRSIEKRHSVRTHSYAVLLMAAAAFVLIGAVANVANLTMMRIS